jgi:hypothetical protein
VEVRIVELNVGIDAPQVWIHGVKISVGILWLREFRRDLDRPAGVDMHLRSWAGRDHAGRHWGRALNWSGALHDDRFVRLLRLRSGDVWNAGYRRQYHESRSTCCR